MVTWRSSQQGMAVTLGVCVCVCACARVCVRVCVHPLSHPCSTCVYDGAVSCTEMECDGKHAFIRVCEQTKAE